MGHEFDVNSINYERLLEGYDMAPPTLKMRVITKIAIQLCQNMELKKCIIFESELQRQHEDKTEKVNEWKSLIIQRTADICEKIPLPLELKKLLNARFHSVVLQLLSWNRLQDKFDLSPLFADSLLTPSDWLAEGKLDEKKIAERLVRDERIPAFQRFKMACFHCIEFSIDSLWNQVSTREDLFHCGKLVEVWSKKMSGEERFQDMSHFWSILFFEGVNEGSISTVFHSWYQGRICTRPEPGAIIAVIFVIMRCESHFIDFNQLFSPLPYMDILYFLLKRAPKEFSYWTLRPKPSYNILVLFVQWPYLDVLIPIIKELWNILPVENYGDLLLTLAHNYSDEADYIRAMGYIDYDYGNVMIELLEESPDHFKRYLFSDNHQTDTNPVKILYIMIRKRTLNYQNIKIFQRIWHHVTPGERRFFLKSDYGELFCCCLARKGNLELLDSLLKECLPEDEVATIQDKISKRILHEVDEEPLYSRLKQEL